MKFAKFLIMFLVIAISFSACGKKKGDTSKNTKKEVTKKEVTKKDVTKKNAKKDVVNNVPIKDVVVKETMLSDAQIKKLSDIFAYGDKLMAERKGYQGKLSTLSYDFSKIKNPLSLKKGSKYKYTSVSYFVDSVWTYVYKTAAKKKRLFWITVHYRHSISDADRKGYNEKFAGFNAKHFKDEWVWVLLKNDIEIQISTSSKEVKSDKAMKKILKEFDIKAIKSIFKKRTKFKRLKKYFAKVKALSAKIAAVNAKFKEKEKEAVAAFTPFLNTKGFLKDYELGKMAFTTSNSFTVTILKDKKIVAFLTVGRPGLIGALVKWLDKKYIKNFKLGKFSAISSKNALVIVTLPTVSIKVTPSYYTVGKEFSKSGKLVDTAASVMVNSLSKVK